MREKEREKERDCDIVDITDARKKKVKVQSDYSFQISCAVSACFKTDCQKLKSCPLRSNIIKPELKVGPLPLPSLNKHIEEMDWEGFTFYYHPFISNIFQSQETD